MTDESNHIKDKNGWVTKGYNPGKISEHWEKPLIWDFFIEGDKKKIVLFRGTGPAAVRVRDNFYRYIEQCVGLTGYLYFPKIASHPKFIQNNIEESNLTGEVQSDIHDNIKQILYTGIDKSDWFNDDKLNWDEDRKMFHYGPKLPIN